MMSDKQCKNCKVWKPTTEFSAHATTRDRLGTWCKPCASSRNAAYAKTKTKPADETRNRSGITNYSGRAAWLIEDVMAEYQIPNFKRRKVQVILDGEYTYVPLSNDGRSLLLPDHKSCRIVLPLNYEEPDEDHRPRYGPDLTDQDLRQERCERIKYRDQSGIKHSIGQGPEIKRMQTVLADLLK